MLDLTSLEKALLQLEDAISYYNSDLSDNDPKLKTHLRAAVIQAFEFTYELSYKMIKRYLSSTFANPKRINEMSFEDIIREACVKDLLLNELSEWKEYRKERGTTSHAYNEEKAQEVFDDIPAFYEEAKYLLKQLKQHNQ